MEEEVQKEKNSLQKELETLKGSHQKELETYRSEIETLKSSHQKELETLKGSYQIELEALKGSHQEERSSYQQKVRDLGLNSSLVTEASKEGLSGRYLELVQRLFPRDKVEFDEDLSPSNVRKLFQETLEQWGEVIRQEKPVDKTPVHNEVTRTETPTLEDVRKMSREEVSRNWELVKTIVSK